MRIESMKQPGEYTFEFLASNEWYKEKNIFNYSGNQKKVLNFMNPVSGVIPHWYLE